MNKASLSRFLSLTLPALALLGVTNTAHSQALQLISNGSFEADPSGTNATSSGATGNIVNTTTFTGYRFYNVATNTGLAFTAQILNTMPSVGSNALRLDVNNPGAAAAGAYGFDIFNNRITITPGVAYRFVFSAAYIGGGAGLTTIAAEFDSAGNFTGEQFVNNITLINTDTLYHTYTVLFTPTVSTAATVDFTFSPGGGVATANALYIDNVRFGVVPEPSTVSMFALAGGMAGLCIFRKRAHGLAVR